MAKKKPDIGEIMKSGPLMRVATIDKVDEESRTVELSFSSEEPADRWFGAEILDHGNGSVEMDLINSGRAPLLSDHNWNMQIGVVESAGIGADRKGRAVVRFGRSAKAEEDFRDVKDGIRTNVSVGYRIMEMVLESDSEEEGPVYRVMRWQPFEISLVSVPADWTVGMGRNSQHENDVIIRKRNPQMLREQEIIEEEELEQPAPEVAAQIDISVTVEEVRKAEQKRSASILALGAKHNMHERAAEFVGSGKSLEEFRAFVLDNIGRGQKPVNGQVRDANVGLTDKEARSYSFVRAIRAAMTNDWSQAGFEREVSRAAEKKFKREPQGQFLVPYDVMIAQRSLNTGNNTEGGYMVGTTHAASSFIELLRNSMKVRALGATVLGGLQGNLSIPKQTGGATAYWLDEGEAATKSQQVIGQVGLTPKTVGAYTEYTRRMILQASPDVENFVRNDLAKTIALAIDLASLKGTGSNGQPTGIMNTVAVETVTISAGAPTFGKMVDLETAIAEGNADVATMSYLASATDRGILKQTEKAAGTAQFVWTDSSQIGVGMLNGYGAHVSNQLGANEIVFGNWADLIIGEWGVLDMNVNPYALDTSGGVRVTGLQDVDIALRHAESFAYTVTG